MLIIIIFWKDSDGLAIAGLVGLGLGALGTWILGKIKEEDQEKEQKKQLNLLNKKSLWKNQEIKKERDCKDPDNPTRILITLWRILICILRFQMVFFKIYANFYSKFKKKL